MATREQRHAHNTLTYALECGSIARASACEVCEQPPSRWDPLQGHHDDYAKPLDVRWLCRSCHHKHHWVLRRAAQQAAA